MATAKFDVPESDDRAVLDVIREHQPCNSTLIAYRLRESVPADLVRVSVIRLSAMGRIIKNSKHGYSLVEAK